MDVICDCDGLFIKTYKYDDKVPCAILRIILQQNGNTRNTVFGEQARTTATKLLWSGSVNLVSKIDTLQRKKRLSEFAIEYWRAYHYAWGYGETEDSFSRLSFSFPWRSPLGIRYLHGGRCQHLRFNIPHSGKFVSHKDNCNVVLGWIPIERLAELTIYPEFMKEQIYNLDVLPQHFVTRV